MLENDARGPPPTFCGINAAFQAREYKRKTQHLASHAGSMRTEEKFVVSQEMVRKHKIKQKLRDQEMHFGGLELSFDVSVKRCRDNNPLWDLR